MPAGGSSPPRNRGGRKQTGGPISSRERTLLIHRVLLVLAPVAVLVVLYPVLRLFSWVGLLIWVWCGAWLFDKLFHP